MKKELRKTVSKGVAIAMAGVVCVGMSSCKHHQNKFVPTDDEIPIIISNHTRIQTKALAGVFEVEDKFGLYVLEQPNTLQENRHVDNACFTFGGESWDGDQSLYYPSSTSLCDFIAYYPYTSDGLSDFSSVMNVKVHTDQSGSGSYTSSDFMVAEKLAITPSFEAVPLTFKHKLVEINIELLPGTAYDSATQLLAAGPEVKIKSVYTSAAYDFQAEAFSNASEKADVTLSGEFTVSSGKLVGKKAIVIPQIVASDHLLVEVKVDGKTYSFAFGTDHSLKSGTKETYSLTIQKSSIQGSIEASIEDWHVVPPITGELTEGEGEEVNPQPPHDAGSYAFNLPDFSHSSVYKVISNDIQVAEITLEYLNGDNIDNQCIVVYPFEDGKADLANGYVARVLDPATGAPVSSAIHGGIVMWDLQTNRLSYVQGNSTAISRIYINEEREISGNSISSAASLTPVAEVVTDARDNYNYSIVKVATQYWMRENLQAKTLINGTLIKEIVSDTEWKGLQNNADTYAHCLDREGTTIYYNYASSSSGNLAPEGWAVPTIQEWAALRDYTNDVNKLLSLSFENGTNLTGINIEGYGYRMKDGPYSQLQIAYFWSDGSVRFEISSEKNVVSQNSRYEGNSVRCVRR